MSNTLNRQCWSFNSGVVTAEHADWSLDSASVLPSSSNLLGPGVGFAMSMGPTSTRNYCDRRTKFGPGRRGAPGGEFLRAFSRRAERAERRSEDSGISSAGSSVSSIGEDVGPMPILSLCGSGTVAAVLAAGAASDSEGTDSSDEEGDDVFEEVVQRTSGEGASVAVSVRRLKVLWRNWPEAGQGQVKAFHMGRDFLDLGSNLKTHFPIQATNLPERNVLMYLQNRSQYHRLGKFGTSEHFPMISCGCGFSYPSPVTTTE